MNSAIEAIVFFFHIHLTRPSHYLKRDRDRETETDRQTETERQRDRQRDRQTERPLMGMP